MTIVLKYVHLFTKEGRLLKEIPLSSLPQERPDFILYAGNFFARMLGSRDYTERDVYHYEEQQVAERSEDENAATHHSDVDLAKQTT